MNTRGLIRNPLFTLSIACAIFSLLLSACQKVNDPTTLPPAVEPTATVLPAQPPTVLPTALTTQPVSSTLGAIRLDLAGIAQDQTVETIAAVPASADGPWWEALPQYTLLTLQGYPISNHVMKPQIFLYPAADLAGFNKNAGQTATDLQALLQTQQAGEQLPFLPLQPSVKQVTVAQVQYLDFKNGKGVRFLTQFANGMVPLNNHELIYTYQGLTSDGKYYLAVVLPVNQTSLPAEATWNGQEIPVGSDYVK